jgi:hypothetical protein
MKRNILSENMRRFGTKNLLTESISKVLYWFPEIKKVLNTKDDATQKAEAQSLIKKIEGAWIMGGDVKEILRDAVNAIGPKWASAIKAVTPERKDVIKNGNLWNKGVREIDANIDLDSTKRMLNALFPGDTGFVDEIYQGILDVVKLVGGKVFGRDTLKGYDEDGNHIYNRVGKDPWTPV